MECLLVSACVLYNVAQHAEFAAEFTAGDPGDGLVQRFHQGQQSSSDLNEAFNDVERHSGYPADNTGDTTSSKTSEHSATVRELVTGSVCAITA